MPKKVISSLDTSFSAAAVTHAPHTTEAPAATSKSHRRDKTASQEVGRLGLDLAIVDKAIVRLSERSFHIYRIEQAALF